MGVLRQVILCVDIEAHGQEAKRLIDLIANIILDYLKKTEHNLFSITKIQGGVL